MRAKNIVIAFAETVRFGWFSRDFFTAFILRRLECLCVITLRQLMQGRSCL